MSADSPMSVSADGPNAAAGQALLGGTIGVNFSPCPKCNGVGFVPISPAADRPATCPKCGEKATHEMPLKRVRDGITYAELWCPNAHSWLSPAADRPVGNSEHGEGITCAHVDGKNRCDLLRGHTGDHMMQGFAVFGPRPVENSPRNKICPRQLCDHPCDCEPLPSRPVENSELRDALDDLWTASQKLNQSQGNAARSRIEELFAEKEVEIGAWVDEKVRLEAEISRLRSERTEIAQEFGVSTDFDLGEHARVVMASLDDFKAELSRLRAIGEVR